MPVERDRVVELVDAETVLGKAGDVGAEQTAAGRHHQPVIGQSRLCAFGRDDVDHLGLGVDRLGAALKVIDVDCLEDVEQRRRQRLGLRLIEPRANHERRLGCDQHDRELLGRNTLEIA